MVAKESFKIIQLTEDRFDGAVELILSLDLDTREEIEHHLEKVDSHYIATDPRDRIIGVIGWYQDNVNYANEAMGDKFPGEDAYWVGFFAVAKDWQDKGVGSKLMSKLEGVVRDLGASKLWVVSVPEARSYYEEKGFELIMEGKIGENKKFFLVKDLS